MGRVARGQILEITDQLVVEECCNCHILFAMPNELYARSRENDKIFFHCPNGHSQHYTETEIHQLKQKLKFQTARADANLEMAQSNERHRRAAVAAHTRTKKRIAAGVCARCNRSFQNLRRHMASKHPGYVETEEIA